MWVWGGNNEPSGYRVCDDSIVWWHIVVWLKIPVNVQAALFHDVLEGTDNMKGSNLWKNVVTVGCYATLWCVWKARNKKAFDNVLFRVLKIVNEIKEKSFLWMKHRSSMDKLVWERCSNFNIRDVIM
ncbi:hypothetical protein HanRHA438_Chr02g0083871 [Helianthus annuus]|nr:hypothetical protein HanRHA438_Chr02g0083871 [Helianthus annuus]